jgi:hypothetical protein
METIDLAFNSNQWFRRAVWFEVMIWYWTVFHQFLWMYGIQHHSLRHTHTRGSPRDSITYRVHTESPTIPDHTHTSESPWLYNIPCLHGVPDHPGSHTHEWVPACAWHVPCRQLSVNWLQVFVSKRWYTFMLIMQYAVWSNTSANNITIILHVRMYNDIIIYLSIFSSGLCITTDRSIHVILRLLTGMMSRMSWSTSACMHKWSRHGLSRRLCTSSQANT